MQLQRSKCLILFATLCLSIPVLASGEPSCSNSSIKGGYGFRIVGSNNAVGQFALMGHFRANGAGSFAGAGTESVNGIIDRPVFSGVYKVQADCTGSGTFTFKDGTSAPVDFVIEADGKQIEIIVAGPTGSKTGEVETGTATKQFIEPDDSVKP
jgi:hypothetical protein